MSTELFGIAEIVNVANTVIDRLFPDPAAAAQAKMKAIELAQNGDLEGLRIILDDRANARNRELEIKKSGQKEHITPLY